MLLFANAFALKGPQGQNYDIPRAMPWAIFCCPFGTCMKVVVMGNYYHNP